MPEIKTYDIVVVGAGGAGVSAAVVASAMGARVALLSKEPAGRGNTSISGGIMTNPGIVPGDSPAQLVQDFFVGGEETGDPRLARAVADGASAATDMLESFGVVFLRNERGELTGDTLIRQGGHTYPRTMCVGTHRGIPIGVAVRAAIARGDVDVYDEVAVTRLLQTDGQVNGVVVLNLISGEPLAFSAGAVILATGGCPWIYYPHCGAMRSTVGDGYALAYWAGAELIDMEQTQYGTEPGFYGPDARLVNGEGEVVREPVGWITRAELGRLITLEANKGKGTPRGGLMIDPRPNLDRPEGREYHRKVLASGMLDPLAKRRGNPAGARWEAPLELTCSAHFTMGGVRIDEWGCSSVPGLYAIGEVSGGLHGANRLGSTALTEIFVMGPRAAAHAMHQPQSPARTLDDSAVHAELNNPA